MTQWVGVQGQAKAAKKCKITPICGVPPREPLTKKFFFVCSLRLVESVEGLNSSLAQSPGKLLSFKLFKNSKKMAHMGLKG